MCTESKAPEIEITKASAEIGGDVILGEIGGSDAAGQISAPALAKAVFRAMAESLGVLVKNK